VISDSSGHRPTVQFHSYDEKDDGKTNERQEVNDQGKVTLTLHQASSDVCEVGKR